MNTVERSTGPLLAFMLVFSSTACAAQRANSETADRPAPTAAADGQSSRSTTESHSTDAGPTSRGAIAARLEHLLDDPALARAHVGLHVVVAETGEVLFSREAEKLFVPASNAKIVTAAVGLDRLGPGYRWSTRLLASGPVRGGTLRGDLWIIGSGDPQLTRGEVREWARQLRRAGIRRIAGDVVGDDRAFESPQWGVGWMWDDLYGGWSSGVSGLQLHPNTVDAYLIPGDSLGSPASFRLEDAGPGLPIEVRVRTGTPGTELRLSWIPHPVPPAGDDVVLAGWIPIDTDSTRLYLATPHPTLYLLEWFALALADAGIDVGGELRRSGPDEPRPGADVGRAIAGAPPAGTDAGWGMTFRSDSLGAVLRQILKPSDNQMAESLLRTIGLEEADEGSAEAGLDVVEETLAGWGIEPGAVALVDGSGLSRYDLLAPAAMTRLLRAVWRYPYFGVFVDALPIAAVDGTLRSRMLATPGAGNVRAKTGSLSNVRALSGYLRDGNGETLIFSMILNGYDAPGAVAVALEDLIMEQISLLHRDVVPGWPAYREGDGF